MGAHTVVDLGHPHHSPNLCQNSPSSSSAACLVSASSSPFFPSKRHCRSHKQPGLWKDPWIWVALPIGKTTNGEYSSFESMETSNKPRTSSWWEHLNKSERYGRAKLNGNYQEGWDLREEGGGSFCLHQHPPWMKGPKHVVQEEYHQPAPTQL